MLEMVMVLLFYRSRRNEPKTLTGDMGSNAKLQKMTESHL